MPLGRPSETVADARFLLPRCRFTRLKTDVAYSRTSLNAPVTPEPRCWVSISHVNSESTLLPAIAEGAASADQSDEQAEPAEADRAKTAYRTRQEGQVCRRRPAQKCGGFSRERTVTNLPIVLETELAKRLHERDPTRGRETFVVTRRSAHRAPGPDASENG